MRQAIQNGLRCTLRTPGKTALFTLIVTVLAALLSVAFCVCAAVQGYLRDCDDYFHTVAELEYIGKDYPDRQIYDTAMEQAVAAQAETLEALLQAEAVLSFEAQGTVSAVPEGLHRRDRSTYDPDCAVICVYMLGEDPASSSLVGQIRQAPYARDTVEGKSVRIRTDTMEDPAAPQPELGKVYVMAGHFFRGTNNYLWFQAETMELPGEGGGVLPAFTELSGGAIPEDSPYLRLAALTAAQNNGCRVQYTGALEDLLPFHQQELLLLSGRSFTPEEYESDAPVCLLSDRVAGMMELAVGDRVTLSVYEGQGDLSLVYLAPPAFCREYEIVGIYGATESHPDRIFLPASCPPGEILPVTGYRLGQFRLENSGAEAFLALAQPLTEAGFRVSVYDQGWAAATEPMEELYFISLIFLGVCLLLVTAALLLQCRLFILRQRDTAQTMHALGTGNGRISMYFLASMGLIAVPAAVLGCLAGKGLERQVLSLLQQFTRGLSERDLRFSVSRISFAGTLDFDPEISPLVCIGAGALLVLMTVLFSLLFTARCLRQHRRDRAPRRPRSVRRYRGRTSRLSGPLKYGLLSLFRSPGRSGTVLLLGLTAAVFFGQLTASLEDSRAQLEALRENAVLTGHAVDASGKNIHGLVVRRQPIESAAASGLLSGWSVSDTVGNVRVLGVSVTAEGREQTLPEPYIPTGGFGIETFFAQMAYEPEWVRTSSVEESYVFCYSAAREVTWLEGCGEADFLGSEWICALPRTVMDAHGIRLGDTVRFLYAMYDRGGQSIDTVELKVAASYVSATESEVVFCPIEFSWRDPGTAYAQALGGAYDSFLFTLEDNGKLDELRQMLEDAGFSPVRTKGGTRTYAVIDDEIYLNTTQSMERQIRYVGTLYNSLYVLTGIVALVLAWLLTASRKTEIALLRALGTPGVRIAANFFTEQAVLCGAGLVLGTALQHWMQGPPLPLQRQLCGAFFCLWCVSALFCLVTMLRRSAPISLSDPE